MGTMRAHRREIPLEIQVENSTPLYSFTSLFIQPKESIVLFSYKTEKNKVA